MSGRAGRDPWERSSRENRAAIDDFIAAAARIPAGSWHAPLRPGGWTPAQVAEHIVLAYEVLVGQLAGDPPMRRILGPVKQAALRWILLPHILFHRSFPIRAGAPREVRPAGPGIEQPSLEPRLRAAAERLDRDVRVSTLPFVRHPYFGPLRLPLAMRLVAVHTEHHTKQLRAFKG
jgi:hypothetical protein